MMTSHICFSALRLFRMSLNNPGWIKEVSGAIRWVRNTATLVIMMSLQTTKETEQTTVSELHPAAYNTQVTSASSQAQLGDTSPYWVD